MGLVPQRQKPTQLGAQKTQAWARGQVGRQRGTWRSLFLLLTVLSAQDRARLWGCRVSARSSWEGAHGTRHHLCSFCAGQSSFTHGESCERPRDCQWAARERSGQQLRTPAPTTPAFWGHTQGRGLDRNNWRDVATKFQSRLLGRGGWPAARPAVAMPTRDRTHQVVWERKGETSVVLRLPGATHMGAGGPILADTGDQVAEVTDLKAERTEAEETQKDA